MPPRFVGQVLFTDGVVRSVYAEEDGRPFVFDSRWVRVYVSQIVADDPGRLPTSQLDRIGVCASCAS
jgi:hypothetical protein